MAEALSIPSTWTPLGESLWSGSPSNLGTVYPHLCNLPKEVIADIRLIQMGKKNLHTQVAIWPYPHRWLCEWSGVLKGHLWGHKKILHATLPCLCQVTMTQASHVLLLSRQMLRVHLSHKPIGRRALLFARTMPYLKIWWTAVPCPGIPFKPKHRITILRSSWFLLGSSNWTDKLRSWEHHTYRPSVMLWVSGIAKAVQGEAIALGSKFGGGQNF